MGLDCGLLSVKKDGTYEYLSLDRCYSFVDYENDPFPFYGLNEHGSPKFSSDYQSMIAWCYKALVWHKIAGKTYRESQVAILLAYLIDNKELKESVLLDNMQDDDIMMDIDEQGIFINKIYP